jgi:glycosyltransferase involved in cell wall biosynthesis
MTPSPIVSRQEPDVHPVRLAHLVSRPIHYMAPLYRELEARPEVDLTVYFGSDASVRGYVDREYGREVRWDTPLLDGYRSRFLPSAAGRNAHGGAPNWDVVREVLVERYDAIWVHGWAQANTWLAAAGSPFTGARMLIREEQTLLHGRPWYKTAVKEVALRALFRRSFGLFIGEENRRWLLHYGMPEERLFPARYCVDNDYFRGRAEELGSWRDGIRAELGLCGPTVLYVAKLIPKKAPFLLIEAFARVRASRECSLLMVGDGELRGAAEEVVTRLRVPDVRFAGFMNQSEVARAYVAADVFCLPSVLHETWGLAINEALNFGLPVVCSDKVGCAADLVRPGWNGFVVPAGEVEPLAEALELLVAQPALRRQLGNHGRSLVGEYSIKACADGIVAACLADRG